MGFWGRLRGPAGGRGGLQSASCSSGSGPTASLLLHPQSTRSELLLFLLPLVNVRALKHALRSYLPRLPALGGGAGGAAGAADPGSAGAGVTCGICSAPDLLSPWAAVPCCHRFCYYCLRSNCAADPQFSCPLCLRRVDAMHRVQLHGSTGSNGDSGGGGSRGGG